MNDQNQINIRPIGFLKSPFTEKFGIPRRPGLIDGLKGVIELTKEYSESGVEKGLKHFSHIWVLFYFHQYANKFKWSPTVRPPRLGGNKRMGVFATRSPQRPNFTGLSAVKLEYVERVNGIVRIHISGIDMMDKTPVLDIKPYLKDSDAIMDASDGWFENIVEKKNYLEVSISDTAKDGLLDNDIKSREDFFKLLKEVIAQDPRPSYYRSNPKDHQKESFKFSFMGHDICFVMNGPNKAHVMEIIKLNPTDIAINHNKKTDGYPVL